VILFILALGTMASPATSYQAELLGASVFEQLVTQGQSAEDAHRAAQAAVTAAFGGTGPGPSVTGAVGSNDPAPGPATRTDVREPGGKVKRS
jgi:hypothetical protein